MTRGAVILMGACALIAGGAAGFFADTVLKPAPRTYALITYEGDESDVSDTGLTAFECGANLGLLQGLKIRASCELEPLAMGGV